MEGAVQKRSHRARAGVGRAPLPLQHHEHGASGSVLPEGIKRFEVHSPRGECEVLGALEVGVCIFGLVWAEAQYQTKSIWIGLTIFQPKPNQCDFQTDSNQTNKDRVGLDWFIGLDLNSKIFFFFVGIIL